MSTVSKASIASAPRDKDQLVRLGRFQLRALATDLGLFATEDSKNAFMAMQVDDQAGAVLDSLKAQDKGGGSTTASAPAADKPKRSPVPASAMKGGEAPAESGGAVLEGINTIIANQALMDEKLGALNERLIKAELTAAVATTLCLMLAEEVMQGASRPDVIAAAIADHGDTIKALEGLGGKAKKGK